MGYYSVQQIGIFNYLYLTIILIWEMRGVLESRRGLSSCLTWALAQEGGARCPLSYPMPTDSVVSEFFSHRSEGWNSPERMSFRKKFIMRWELKLEKTGLPCCRSRYSGKRELSVCYTEGFYKTFGRNEGETQQGGWVILIQQWEFWQRLLCFPWIVLSSFSRIYLAI